MPSAKTPKDSAPSPISFCLLPHIKITTCSPVSYQPLRPIMAYSIAQKSALRKKEDPGMKFVISGITAWAYELAIGHYLEFIKIMKQTKKGSYVQLTREITHKKGVIGIWDGFFPWGSIQAIFKGSVFGFANAWMRNQLQAFVDDRIITHGTAEVISGGFGGGVQGIVLSPTLLLKTRVMTNPIFRTNMTAWKTTNESLRVGVDVIRREGLLALMKGSFVFSLKRVADWSSRYFFCTLIESQMIGNQPNMKLSTSEEMFSSLLGGALSTVVTLPIDVMVAQIQQASKAGAKTSFFETFQHQYEQGGIRQLATFGTKGFMPRVAHVAFTTMLMKAACSSLYEKYEMMTERRYQKEYLLATTTDMAPSK